MSNTTPKRIKSISEYHSLRQFSKPEHPLISVIDLGAMKHLPAAEPLSVVFDFYSISLKRNFDSNIKYHYGQQQYDFDEGTMFFIAPNQVFSVQAHADYQLTGWMLLIHPDFLWNTPLAKTIKQYEYFSYSVHQALFLSEKEETVINDIVQNIGQEYHSNIDVFSQGVIIAQLELLLRYADRFYHRQFLTRKISSHTTVDRVEQAISAYFENDDLLRKGLPSVQYVANTLNISPNYLSALLKAVTGRTTQQHIHDKLIEKAKEKLSVTGLTVSEIAYELGFEHSQSFSKLFKIKTSLSPLEFRESFN